MSRRDPRPRRDRRKGSPYPKAELAPRLLAKVADLLVAGLFARFIPSVGVALGLAFLLLADGLPNGQSPGKRLLGVKAVHLTTRRACNVTQSIVRNLPVALGFAFAMNPFLAIVAVPILLFEVYMAWNDRSGVRLGDIFADTQVIDGKVPWNVAVPVDELLRRSTVQLGREVGGPAEIQTRS